MKTSSKVAFPLLALVAVAAGIAGALTGAVFLIGFAVVGLVAAIAGAIWASRRIARPGR